MKRFMLPSLAAVAVLMAAIIVLRPQATRIDAAAEANVTMPIQEMHAKIDAAKLPAGEFEDQALVFTAIAKH